MAKVPEVYCGYCGVMAELVDGSVIYPSRADLRALNFWYCDRCNAYVGVHKGSATFHPYGTLANANLREWRKAAHSVFDPLWALKAKEEGCSFGAARTKTYAWLAKELGIKVGQCHIACFDEEQCANVIALCEGY